MKALFVLLVFVRLSGCATMDRTTAEMAKGADVWCLGVPESMRLAERDAINAQTKYATVRIDCEMPEPISE